MHAGAGPSPRASCPESSWAAASQSHVPLVTSLSRSFGKRFDLVVQCLTQHIDQAES